LIEGAELSDNGPQFSIRPTSQTGQAKAGVFVRGVSITIPRHMRVDTSAPHTPTHDVSPDPRAYEQRTLTRFLFGINRLYGRVWHRVEVQNTCPIPRDGAGILICNHSAGIDPVLLQSAVPRLITWMMAREYFDIPGMRWTCGQLQFIPVTRSGRDSTSLKSALRALAHGKLLGVFPEGRIATSNDLLPFQPGVAQMAAKTRTVIYPTYLAGLARNQSVGKSLLKPQSAKLFYGEPIQPLHDADALLALMTRQMTRLKNQALA
jgi:1-acyl-sn-glycerol-3-phosphate acyltransferase